MDAGSSQCPFRLTHLLALTIMQQPLTPRLQVVQLNEASIMQAWALVEQVRTTRSCYLGSVEYLPCVHVHAFVICTSYQGPVKEKKQMNLGTAHHHVSLLYVQRGWACPELFEHLVHPSVPLGWIKERHAQNQEQPLAQPEKMLDSTASSEPSIETSGSVTCESGYPPPKPDPQVVGLQRMWLEQSAFLPVMSRVSKDLLQRECKVEYSRILDSTYIYAF